MPNEQAPSPPASELVERANEALSYLNRFGFATKNPNLEAAGVVVADLADYIEEANRQHKADAERLDALLRVFRKSAPSAPYELRRVAIDKSHPGQHWWEQYPEGQVAAFVFCVAYLLNDPWLQPGLSAEEEDYLRAALEQSP